MKENSFDPKGDSARFHLLHDFKSSEFHFVAKASARPIRMYFSLSPNKFDPNDWNPYTPITLWALAVWAESNETVHESLCFEFLENGTSHLSSFYTTSGGATYDYDYVENAARTYTVRVSGAGTLPYMVEPVTLEVYRDTRLLFWVERDNSSKHVFHGRLVTTTSGGVAYTDQTFAGGSILGLIRTTVLFMFIHYKDKTLSGLRINTMNRW